MKRSLAPLFAAALLAVATLVPAAVGAATAPGAWPALTISPDDPAAQNHEGTMSFGLIGMPDATYTVTKTIEDFEDTEIIDNDEEYIAAGTPFGAVFGASGPSTATQFLKTRIDAAGGSAATVTVTFASPVPAGVLGFAVNDVDVDQLVISGIAADGTGISGAQLRGATFNLCDTVDAPPFCDGVVAPFDLPTWDPASSTLTGSDEDTDGAGAWFQPSVPVASLTFVFTGRDGAGSPSFRLWVAARQAAASGTVAFAGGASPKPVTLELVGPGGDVVATTTTAADGSYAFPPVLAEAGYTVRLVVPDGYTAAGSSSTGVDLSSGDVVVDFTLSAGTAPAPEPDTSPAPASPRFTG